MITEKYDTLLRMLSMIAVAMLPAGSSNSPDKVHKTSQAATVTGTPDQPAFLNCDCPGGTLPASRLSLVEEPGEILNDKFESVWIDCFCDTIRETDNLLPSSSAAGTKEQTTDFTAFSQLSSTYASVDFTTTWADFENDLEPSYDYDPPASLLCDCPNEIPARAVVSVLDEEEVNRNFESVHVECVCNVLHSQGLTETTMTLTDSSISTTTPITTFTITSGSTTNISTEIPNYTTPGPAEEPPTIKTFVEPQCDCFGDSSFSLTFSIIEHDERWESFEGVTLACVCTKSYLHGRQEMLSGAVRNFHLSTRRMEPDKYKLASEVLREVAH